MTDASLTQSGVSRLLAGFAVADGPEAEAARHVAHVVVSRYATAGVAHATSPASTRLRKLAESLCLPTEASVLGRRERTGAIWAAMLHGTAMRGGVSYVAPAAGQSDTAITAATISALGPPVVAAGLTAAEMRRRSGAELYAAVGHALEIGLRLTTAISPAHEHLGWDLGGTVGHISAAMCAARLLYLDEEQALVALALSSVEAAGVLGAAGTMTESLHTGKAAADGVEAALLASAGISGPTDPIEAKRGFAALLGSAASSDVTTPVADLGVQWRIGSLADTPDYDTRAVVDDCTRVLRPLLGAGTNRLIEVMQSLDELADVAPLFAAATAERST